MRRLALPAWACGLWLTIEWLRHLRPDGDPAFAAARGFALALAAYLAVATIMTFALALCRVRVRLPLVPLLIVASLSTPLAAPAFAAPMSTTATSAPAPPVMHRLGPATSPTTAPAPQPAPTPHPTRTGESPAPAPSASTWRVRHGDCMWTISRHVLAARLGRAPTNAEVAAYWRPLIDANRSRLVRPSDPGLLFAGQELVLP